MPKGFTEQEKELIREALLREGEKQFAAHGLKKTSVEELAQAARISKGAFYLFYESKEALFMDVMEQAEQRFRGQMLAMVDVPGPSPRARLWALLKEGFAMVRTIPTLQVFTGGDFDLLLRRVPAQKLREHMDSDLAFLQELIARCQSAGITIRVQPQALVGLLYPLVLALVREDDPEQNPLFGSIDLLLELIAAYCLGEVEMQLVEPGRR